MNPVSRSSGEGRKTQNHNCVISPSFRRLPPPLIVVGMHRSGTSLVSGMLTLLGIYMDPAMSRLANGSSACPPGDALRRFGYGEAAAFRQVNDSILLSAGADWRNADPFMQHRDHRAFRRWCLFLMQHAALGGLKRDYLAHCPLDMSAWGWKDPRNSLTLPYWLRLFPDARILHVRRSRAAVVESLLRRDSSGANGSDPIHPGVPSRVRRVLKDPGYAAAAVRRRLCGLRSDPAPQDLSRTDYYALTELYVGECLQAKALGMRYLEVQYEDLLERPYAFAVRMARFARICPTENDLERAVSFVERPPMRQMNASGTQGIRRSCGRSLSRAADRELIRCCSSAR